MYEGLRERMGNGIFVIRFLAGRSGVRVWGYRRMYEGLREMKSCLNLLAVRALGFVVIDECMRG